MRESLATRGTHISASALTFVLSFLAALSFAIAANMRIHSMCREVNLRLANDRQISLSGTRWKMYEVLRLHAEMYPESPKRWQMWTLAALAAVFLFGGFFGSSLLPL
jgi:hypothetical protein